MVSFSQPHAQWREKAEQLRVSRPGIDNTVEAAVMAAMAAIQLRLVVLGALGVKLLGIVDTTEFLVLTLISVTICRCDPHQCQDTSGVIDLGHTGYIKARGERGRSQAHLVLTVLSSTPRERIALVLHVALCGMPARAVH